MRRITVDSELARCDRLSNEHSETAGFLAEGKGVARFCNCVPSHLSKIVRDFCTS